MFLLTSRWPRLLPGLVLAALLAPTAHDRLFNGLPLSTPLEYGAFIVLLPLLVSTALSRAAGRALRRFHPRAAATVLALAVASIGLKAAVLLSGDPRGFAACYRYIGDAARPTGCEFAFEHPLGRGRETRIDTAIDFTPDGWNLSFINSRRFNFGSWMENRPLRHRLPIGVSWTARVDVPARHTLVVDYVGEGTVTLGRASAVMSASYAHPSRAILAAPAGEQRLLVDFSFNDRSRTDGPRMTTPYAAIGVFLEDEEGRRVPFTFVPGGPAAVRVALGWLTDGALLGLVALAAGWHARLLWPDRAVVLGSAFTLLAFPWLATSLGVERATLAPLVPLLALGALLPRPRLRRVVLTWFACVTTALMAFLPVLGPLGRVGLRPPGDDWLTYESLARDVLEQGLRGGEAVFYYQPLVRYVRAVERLLFGDGELLLVTNAFALLAMALVVLLLTLARGRARMPRLVSGLVGACLLGLVLSPVGTWFLLQGASEVATWVLVPAGSALALTARARPSNRVLGAALLATSVLARTNQLPGTLALLAAGWLMERRASARIGMLLVTALLLSLPLAHNIHYGGQMVPFTSSSDIAENRVIRPGQLLAIGHDDGVRATVARQLQYVTVAFPQEPPLTGSPHDRVVWLASVRLLQALWLVAVVVLLLRGPISTSSLLVAAAPLLYLGVHVVYQVETYYPRHVIMGHIACGIAVAYLATRQGRAPSVAPAPPEPVDV